MNEEIVKPTGTRQARLERGVKDAPRLPQESFGVVERQELNEALRADARPAAEESLEVVVAQADALRGGFKRRLLVML